VQTSGYGICIWGEAMTEIVLELAGVSAGYGETHILEDISFTLKKGERLAVIGRNGVGKTTLLSTIMGLTRLHAGNLSLKGENINRMPTHMRSAAGIGIVPQTRDIFQSLSVEENLIAALRGDASLEEAYTLFPRLKERRNNGGGQLSGGEQQMLSIARTLLTRPEIVLLDEPLEGLAPVICDMLLEVFETLAAEGRHTIVLVEQHVDMVLGFADRAVVLDNGVIVYQGDAKALRKNSEILERHIGIGLTS